MLESKLSLKQQYNAFVSKTVSTMTRWVYITFLNDSIYRIYKKNDLAKCFCTQNLFNDVSKNAGIPSSYYEDRSMKSICEENYIIKHNINYE